MCCSAANPELLAKKYQNKADRQSRKAAKHASKRDCWLSLLAPLQASTVTARTQRLTAKYQAKADRQDEKAAKHSAKRDYWLNMLAPLKPVAKIQVVPPPMNEVPSKHIKTAPPTYKQALKDIPTMPA